MLWRITAQGIKKIEYTLAVISCAFIMILMLLGAADVLGRYLFNHPITGAYEISQVIMAGVILFAWAFTMRKGMHVRVDMFVARLSPRPRAILNLVTTAVSLVMFIIITWRSAFVALQYVNEQRAFQTINFPSYPFHFFVPVSAFLLCLELIIQITYLGQELRRVKGSEVNVSL
jgi:TRAP-type transport system small permease protein